MCMYIAKSILHKISKWLKETNLDDNTLKMRITWLDSMRGCAFLMVIYVHCTSIDSMFFRNYFMPMMLTSFLFVSGYLHKDANFWPFFEQRTRTLYVPSVILGLFIVFSSWFFPLVSSDIDICHEIMGVIFQYDGYNHGVWFVAALYAYSLLFYVLVRHFSGNYLLGIGIILYTGNWLYFRFSGPLLPWYLCQFGFSVYYMILGYLYRKYEERIDIIIYRNKNLIWLAFALYLAAIYWTNKSYSIMGSQYLVDCFLITNLGLYVYIYFNKQFLKKIPVFIFIGCNSLLYFGLHGKILTLTTFLTSQFPEIKNYFHTEIFQLITVVMVAILTALPVIIINRFAPQIIGKGYKLCRFN